MLSRLRVALFGDCAKLKETPTSNQMRLVFVPEDFVQVYLIAASAETVSMVIITDRCGTSQVLMLPISVGVGT